MSDTILALEGLTKTFGRHRAVHDLSLSVARGDVYGLLGLNGAGKTTTLKMVLGLLRPTSGRVALFGASDAAGRLAGRARLGALVESPAFYAHFSAGRNLELFASLHGGVERDRIARILEIVGLADAGRKRVRDFSLGMKQRLAIGLALIHRPELVILDEPTNGLDPNGILEMRRLIGRLAGEGVTFVISSHLLHEIELVCTRVAMLENGALVFERDLAALAEEAGSLWVLRHTADAVPLDVLDGCGAAEVEVSGSGTVRFTLPEGELPGLHRALVAAGVGVVTLTAERVTLEDMFLRRSRARAEGALS